MVEIPADAQIGTISLACILLIELIVHCWEHNVKVIFYAWDGNPVPAITT
jgi:hypothetical protein